MSSNRKDGYKILTGDCLSELEGKVNYAIDKNWICQGGVFISFHRGKPSYLQTMFKYKDEAEE